ncbi:response regulator [Verrucomicrobiota bacterium]
MEKEKKKILLIDDDTSLLVTLSDFLSFEGYEVITADSGEQGLAKLTEMIPDLIILDMSMPGMGGVGFLKEISSSEGKPRHPVLVLTARANMAEFFADIEVDGFVAKPCDPNDLLMEVSRIIFLTGGIPVQETRKPEIVKKKVLIGEDDTNVNRGLLNMFVQAGYIANSVSQGPEVLEKAIVERPDVVVMKLVFAGMNGDAVANVLKEMPNTKDIPIVLYDDSDTKAVDSINNIKQFVKSNDPATILAAVKEVLK